MKNGWSVFGWEVSWALLFWSAVTVFGEENPRPVSSIFAADGQVPGSIEEMLPAHTRQGLQQTEWMRMNSAVSRGVVTTVSLRGQMSADIEESFAPVYRRLEERRDLFARQPSNNRFVRATDAIFTPAPIRIGTTQISFTPVTAWKKRNPLCLLNPLVFHISF